MNLRAGIMIWTARRFRACRHGISVPYMAVKDYNTGEPASQRLRGPRTPEPRTGETPVSRMAKMAMLHTGKMPVLRIRRLADFTKARERAGQEVIPPQSR